MTTTTHELETTAPVAVFREIIRCGFNAGDLDALDAYVAPDAIEHQEGAQSGIDGLRTLITELRTAFPDLHLEIQDQVTSGDTTWARIHATGTNDGPLFGRPATGRAMAITVIDIVRVVDGRMVEHWGVADRLAMLKQVGMFGRGA